MKPREVYTRWSRPAPKRRKPKVVPGGDVSEHQLYRDIAEGYRYFMAQKLKRETLRNVR